jgi:hypothetical protein
LRKALVIPILWALSAPAHAATVANLDLGSAAAFGLIGGTISNTGVSSITGNVGATTTITGFPPGVTTGTLFTAGDAASTTAYNDFVDAYIVDYSDITTPVTHTLADLSGSRSFTGNNVYSFAATDVVSVTGITLIFDAENDSSEVFIIKVARDLTINGPLTFDLMNGASARNIYWIVGRTVTISSNGPAVTWDGSILAGTSFTMSANPGGSDVLAGTINGCVFAQAATTLAGQTNVGGCASPASSVPEPSMFGLLAFACCLGGYAVRRKKKATDEDRRIFRNSTAATVPER